MSEPARRIITYQDVLDAPDGFTAEILNGELSLSPRPADVHQAAGTELGGDLLFQYGRSGRGGPGGWVFRHEPELWLGRPDPTSQVLVPDLAGWRKERFVRPEQHGHTLAPDWVCEILSPGSGNVRRDRLIKPDIYLASGIEWMWIVDPIAHLVEVYKRTDVGYARVAGDSGRRAARLPPFDAVELDMTPWWSGSPEEERPDV